MSEQLTVCIAGCGGMGAIHAEGYNELDEKVRLIFRSASESRANEFAEKYGGEGFTDYSKAVAEADIVDICATHEQHMPMACEAFAAGKHVIMEKPISRTIDEADKIIEAADKAGTKLMVCENTAFHTHILEIDQAIARGDVGRPFIIEMSSMSLWSGLKGGTWRTDYAKTGGGVLIDLGSHYVYLARRWCQNLESIFARFSHASLEQKGEDTAVVMMNDRDGLTAVIHASWGAPGSPELPWIIVYGTEGTLVSRNDGLFLTTGGGGTKPKQSTLCDGQFMPLWWEGIRIGARTFVECVQKDEAVPSAVTGETAREVLELVKAAERSAKEGVVVRM